MKLIEEDKSTIPDVGALQDQENGVLGKLFTSAIFVSILTYTAYLIGMIYYQEYMNSMHFNYQIFPKNSTDYFIYCYNALINLFPTWLVAEISGIRIVVVIVSLCVLLGAVNLGGKLISESKWMIHHQKGIGQNKRIRLAGHFFLPPFLALVFLYYTPIFLSIVLFVPVLIGGQMGRKVAAEDIKKYERGCDVKKNAGIYCTEVIEAGKKISVGFVIDASDKYIAILDGGRARTIPISGKEFSELNSHSNVETAVNK